MRRSFKHILSLPDRLTNEAQHLRDEAKQMPHGIEREMLLRKARQAETAAHGQMAFVAGVAGAHVR